MRMTAYATWDLLVVGGMLGLMLRWLLHLKVQAHWAVFAGATVTLLEPWITRTFESLLASHLLPSLVLGGAVAAALVTAVQSILND